MIALRLKLNSRLAGKFAQLGGEPLSPSSPDIPHIIAGKNMSQKMVLTPSARFHLISSCLYLAATLLCLLFTPSSQNQRQAEVML
jgi:hypothetical protein